MKKIIFLFSLLLASTPVLSQSLSIFDIDTTAFPIMKAKFLAIDAGGKQVPGINPSDLSLSENGSPREVISVSCPPTKSPQRISSTIVIDVSGSMSGGPLEIAKTVAKTWVNSLPLGQSDCALVSFDHANYFNQDFTTNRNKLLSAIDNVISGGGTDYNAAMINPVAGGILTAKTGKHNKVIVFITDGLPNNPPDEARIIAEALAYEIVIHCITIGLPAHPCMAHFVEQTGGLLFENVKSEKDAKSIAHLLLGRSVYDFQPCELQWKSDMACEQRFIDVALNWNSSSVKARYYPLESGIAKIVMNPLGVRFINKPIGKQADTIISITAINADFYISGFNSSDSRFSIYPPTLTIPKGETKEVALSFTPTDSSFSFSYIEILNDVCATKYFAASAYPNSKLKSSSLKLTSPNGGEEFQVGTDTLITWEGVLPQDIVKLEYSLDSGLTWTLITDTASGLKYLWKNVPKPVSKSCFIRISTNNNGVNIQWERTYGGSDEDETNDIIQTKNGYIVVGTTKSSDGDVDIPYEYGAPHVWVIYLNKLGEPIWKKTFGCSADYGISVKEMDDGNFVLGAITFECDLLKPDDMLASDYWIIKLDISGNIIWSKRYGGTKYESLFSIEKTYDGGIIAVGAAESSDGNVSVDHNNGAAWIIKLDPEGKLEWQKTFGQSKLDYASSVAQTIGNCFVISGYTNTNIGDIPKNPFSQNGWIAKINYEGNLLWSKTLGGSRRDIFNSIKETRDFGYIVAGQSQSNDGDIKVNNGFDDAIVTKLDANGNVEWMKSFGGSSNDIANSIIELRDGGFLFAGTSSSRDGDVNLYNPKDTSREHLWIVKLNDSGQIMWSKLLKKYFYEFRPTIQQTDDGGFIVSAQVHSKENSGSDFLVIKYSPEQTPQSDVSDSLFSIVAPTVTALNINMGQVVLGSYKDSVITAFIKNTSKYDCQIKDISSASSDFYVISNPTFTLKGNTEQAVEIHFKPSKLGKIYSNINIVTQDTSFAQSIEGEGIQPTIQISANLIDFGKVNVKELKDTAVVLLQNISGLPIDISDVKLLGPDTKQFEILEGGGAFTLGGGSTRELKLRFKPVYIGRTSCMLGFYHNGANSPAKAQLYGQGVGGLVSVSDDSAFAGDKVKINMVLSHIQPTSLQNVASSFRAKLKYLTAPLTLVNASLKIGETNDSTIIEVSGVIGSDSVLYSIDYVANDTPRDFTTIDLEEIKWYDAGGNEIEYEAETQNGSFKLLKYLGMAKVYCTSDSALPGETASLKLKTFGIDPASFKEIAPKFQATLRYQKTLLAAIDKSLTVNYDGDSAFVHVKGDVGESPELASIDFIAGLGAVDSTTIDIVEIKWLNSKDKEVVYETHTEGGLFKLLGVCREGGERLFNAEGKAGIEELSPNPARDEINVTVNQTEEGDSYLIVYNILGNEVMREQIGGVTTGRKEIKLNITNCSRGIYYVKYQSPTVTEVKSFVAD